MRQSNRMKRILREQCRHRRTRIGRKWSPRRSSSSKPRVTPQPPSNRREVTQQGREGIQEKIDAELHMVGLEHFSEVIAQRMTLLEVLDSIGKAETLFAEAA
jgi:hypothetical protein